MESFNTLNKNGVKISSPVAAFNNFMLELTKEISLIYNQNVCEKNNCIFNDNEILLFGWIKLMKDAGIQLLKPITKSNKDLVIITLDNTDKLIEIMNKYFFIKNDVINNFDTDVSKKYVDDVIKEIKSTHVDDLVYKLYYIPFKHKISKLVDIVDGSFDKLFNRYTYVLNVKNSGPIKYEYRIIRLLSSEYNESYSIDNIEIEQETIMLNNVFDKSDLSKFIQKLMYYGEID